MKTELLSFLYLYGVGGVLFLGCLILALKQGALDLARAPERRVLLFLVAGYACYIAYHAITQFVLPGNGGL